MPAAGAFIKDLPSEQIVFYHYVVLLTLITAASDASARGPEAGASSVRRASLLSPSTAVPEVATKDLPVPASQKLPQEAPESVEITR